MSGFLSRPEAGRSDLYVVWSDRMIPPISQDPYTHYILYYPLVDMCTQIGLVFNSEKPMACLPSSLFICVFLALSASLRLHPRLNRVILSEGCRITQVTADTREPFR